VQPGTNQPGVHSGGQATLLIDGDRQLTDWLDLQSLAAVATISAEKVAMMKAAMQREACYRADVEALKAELKQSHKTIRVRNPDDRCCRVALLTRTTPKCLVMVCTASQPQVVDYLSCTARWRN
jgi:hypothetical protein